MLGVTEEDINLEYKYFVKTSKYLPVFLKNKIDNMPSNKAIYWKGIYFFGKLQPDDKDKIVFFEKTPQYMIITEQNSKCRSIYHKYNNMNQILIKRIYFSKKY